MMERQKPNNKPLRQMKFNNLIRDIIIKPRTPRWEKQFLLKKETEEYFAIHTSNRHHIVKKYYKSKHFLKWAIKLIVPDFLIGHPNLWDNFKTLRKHPQFKPLRMAIAAWMVFTLTLGSAGIYSLNQAVKILAASSTFVDNSQATFDAGTYSDTQWNGASSWLDLNAAGKIALTGNYISSVKDTTASTTWNTLSWTPSQPFYKELPNNAVIESGYSTGNADMTGNVGLWHLNEAGANAQEGGTITDNSGSANNGILYTGSDGLNKSTTGKFNTALSFDGVNDYVGVLDSASLDISGNYSLEVWFKFNSTSDYFGIFAKRSGGTINYQTHLSLSGANMILNAVHAGTVYSDDKLLNINTWYHTVAVYNGATFKFYIDGVEEFSAVTSTNPTPNDFKLIIGKDGETGAELFNGVMDEVAIYNRDLSATEILNNYKRGALKLKFQVRDCDDVACSGESWVGPAASTTDYYSELYNTSTSATPSLSLSGLGNNRYFQYKAFFDTASSTLSADTSSVTINYTANYPPNTPINSQPANASTTVSLLPTLTGSAFFDSNSDLQSNARWELDDNADFSLPEWTRTAGAVETSTVVNSTNGTFANNLSGKTELAHNTTYYWRVAYKDAELWSASSTATSFTTNIIATPVNSEPINAATVVTLTPLLSASAFSDEQTGHTHTASRWVVDDNADFSSPTYDSGETPSAETSRAVQAGSLSNLNTYYWIVKYKDSVGQWSASSTATYFDVNISSASVEVRPVFGNTTVDQGDVVKIDVQVINFASGAPLNDATAIINIYDPAGAKLVDGGAMNYIADSNGIYRYSYNIPSTSGSYLYEVTATYSGKLGYGASNFEVRTIAADVSSTQSTITTNLDTTVSSRGSQSSLTTVGTQVESASSTLSGKITTVGVQVENASSTVMNKLNTVSSNLDILIGAMVVTQSTVDDVSPTTTSFITALINATDNFYNNAVLTFTSGNLDGQTRRISNYDGTSKTITLSPALTSAPANSDAFTIVKQNVYVEEQLAEHETAQATSRTRVEDIQTKTTDIQTKVTDIQSTVNTTYSLLQTVDGKIDIIDTNTDTLLTNLQTVDDNVDAIVAKWGASSAADIVSDISGAKTVIDNIRSSQQLNYTVELSDMGEVLTGNTYRAKLTILNHESQSADAVSSPSIILYDSVRATATTSIMTKLSTGIYEYTYSVPSDSTSGSWETVVSVDLGGALAITRQDYWEVEGSPAQVLINSMSDLSVPSIAANVTISNEGAASYEYQYEWCVVSAEDNACGGGNDVFYSSAAKYILTGEDWDTTLNATVPDTGDYWFKLVVYFGTEASGASQTFTAVEEDEEVISSGGGGGVAEVSLNSVYNKLSEVQNDLNAYGKTKTAYEDMQLIKNWIGVLPGQLSQPLYKEVANTSALLNNVISLLGETIDPSSPAFRSLLDISKVNSADLQEMKNKLTDLRAISSVTRKIVEQTITEPIVETWMTFDSVVFNFLITNPLAEIKTLKFKSYLPIEVKPEHIMDLNGLSIDYDSSAATYYVWGNVALDAGQSITKKVEIKDIWIFDEAEIESLKKQAETLFESLKKTQYEAQGTLLKNENEVILNIILLNQKEGYRTPQDHIVAHRTNEEKMAGVKRNLEKMKDLVVQSGASQGMIGKVGGIQTFATWGIILSIVFGFGLLAVIIFAMWRHQTLMAAAVMGMDRKEIFERMGKKVKNKKNEDNNILKSITNITDKIGAGMSLTTSRLSGGWRLPWKKILARIMIVGLIIILGILVIKFAPVLFSSRTTTFEREMPAIAPVNQENVVPHSVSPNSETATRVEMVFSEQSNPKLKILNTPTNWLNVRDEASLLGEIIARVYPDEQYEYTSEKDNIDGSGWYYITIPKGKSGWVFKDYVQEIKN